MNPADYKIMLVEDDPDQMELMRKFISKWGYQLKMVGDGQEALDAMSEFTPDLVLLDLYLPEVSGIEVLHELKNNDVYKEYSEIPIILLSSDTAADTVMLGLSSGARDYMAKPIRMAELVLKIDNFMEMIQSRREIQAMYEKLQKEKRILLQYFSQDTVTAILEGGREGDLSGANITASILFLDIRNSTGLAEGMEPPDFAKFVSTIFTDFMDLIFKHNGSVNKLLGDGILATFGPPIPNDKDAENALKCAIEIKQYLEMYNLARPDYLTEDIRIGLGIATGPVFAGNIGSFRRMEYTVMGDAVNLAARLEGLTKKTNSVILVDQSTLLAAGEGFTTKQVGLTEVRGKQEKVELHSVQGFKK